MVFALVLAVAQLVEEIMNRELFTARLGEPAKELVEYFTVLGIAASPVLSLDGSLVGMISLRDLAQATADSRIEDLMRTPVTSIDTEAPIEVAARILGETGYHRLPVVDRDSRVVGIISSIDVIRGLMGIPTRHPETFPHYDAVTGLIWTDDVPLEMDRVDSAPEGPGLIAIVHGGAGIRERVVWAEMSEMMRTRLIDIMSLPQDAYPSLQYWLQHEPLRFRAASLSDRRRGERIVDQLQSVAGTIHH
jgi:hypothetical protein